MVSNWEQYIHNSQEPDVLVQTAIAHYQFEAIHPFLDGNGRIGRLLIPIMLYDKDVLSYPLLYVSEHFENNRDQYYGLLRMVDNSNEWEPWIKYVLSSIKIQAIDTQQKVNSMLALYKNIKERLAVFNSQYAIDLLDIIFESPVVSFKSIKNRIRTNSYQTIYNLLKKFQDANILYERTGAKRNKTYVFNDLFEIIR